MKTERLPYNIKGILTNKTIRLHCIAQFLEIDNVNICERKKK